MGKIKIKTGSIPEQTTKLLEDLRVAGLLETEISKVGLGKWSYFIKTLLWQMSYHYQGTKDKFQISPDKSFFEMPKSKMLKRFGSIRISGKIEPVYSELLKILQAHGCVRIARKAYYTQDGTGHCTVYEACDTFFQYFPQDLGSVMSRYLGTTDIKKVSQKSVREQVKTESESLDIKWECNISVSTPDLASKYLNSVGNLRFNASSLDQAELEEIYKDASPAKISSHFHSLHDYLAGNWFLTEASTGRLYSNFTNFPTHFRHALQIKNSNGSYTDLSCIDARSSQIWLFSEIIGDQELNEIVAGTTENPDFYYYIINNLKTLQQGITNKTVLRKTEQRIGVDLTETLILTRDQIKADVYNMLFSSVSGNTITDQVLKACNPRLYELIRKAKSDLSQFGEKLASKLQQLESQIFRPVWEKYSDICVLLHDAIYFPKATGKNKNWGKIILSELQARVTELGLQGAVFSID